MTRARTARRLGSRSVVIGVGAVAALAVAFYAVAGAHKSAGVGPAHVEARVLIDTTASQLVNAGSAEVITLPLRANLIADQMAGTRTRALLARDAGLQPRQLDVVPPSAMAPAPFLTPLVNKVAPVASTTSAPYVVSLYTDEATSPKTPTPVILVQTQAPTAKAASTLARAAISVLSSLAAPSGGGPPAFVARTVETPQSLTLPTKSHRTVYGIAGAMLLFVFWCVGTSLVTSIRRRVRRVQLA